MGQGSVDISVVLATYNRAASLRTTLESFAKLVIPPSLSWELLVVDNNSRDNTRAVVENFMAQLGPRVRYVFEGTQGRSAAINAGVSSAQGSVVAFTDDDVLLDKNWLANLWSGFDDTSVQAIAGRIFPRWIKPKPSWLEMDGQQAIVNFDMGDVPKEIFIAPMGANSAFRKEVFARHGLFRLDLGVRGDTHTITCDDTEFAGRLMRVRDKIVYCPAAIVHHPVDPERATKKYFLRWYYYNGVSLVRTDGLPNIGVFYFGVPRWFYRELLENAARWFTSVNPIRRFRYKLRTCRSLGYIAESRRLSQARKQGLAAQLEASQSTSIAGSRETNLQHIRGTDAGRQFYP